MNISKDLVQKAGIVPNLQLAIKQDKGGVKGTGPHTVKMIDEKLINTINFETGKEVPTVRYFFEEDGNKKQYDVEVKDKNDNLHYLIQRFAEIEKDETVILEYKRKGMKGYIDVQKTEKTNDIPIIEADSEIEDKENFDKVFGNDEIINGNN